MQDVAVVHRSHPISSLAGCQWRQGGRRGCWQVPGGRATHLPAAPVGKPRRCCPSTDSSGHSWWSGAGSGCRRCAPLPRCAVPCDRRPCCSARNRCSHVPTFSFSLLFSFSLPLLFCLFTHSGRKQFKSYSLKKKKKKSRHPRGQRLYTNNEL